MFSVTQSVVHTHLSIWSRHPSRKGGRLQMEILEVAQPQELGGNLHWEVILLLLLKGRHVDGGRNGILWVNYDPTQERATWPGVDRFQGGPHCTLIQSSCTMLQDCHGCSIGIETIISFLSTQ